MMERNFEEILGNGFRIEYVDAPAAITVEQKEDLGYWLDRMAQTLPALEFPSAVPFDPGKPGERASLYFPVRRNDLTALKKLAETQDADLFTGITALLNAILYIYTRQEELLLCSVKLDHSAAIFPLQTQFSGSDNFNTLLGHVKDVITESRAHNNFSFMELLEELVFTDIQTCRLLLQAVLIVQEKAGPEIQDEWSEEALEVIRKKSDLLFLFSGSEQGGLDITYNKAVYDERTIISFGNHLQYFLSAVTRNPDIAIDETEYMPEEEQYQLLHAFNDTAVLFNERNLTLTQLFELQVSRQPDHTALICEGHQLTYYELNEQVNQLAAIILSYTKDNPLKEPLIAICLERGFHVYISMLAILKSGAGYLPLDPHYPEERIRFMLSDTKVDLVITETGVIAHIPYLQQEKRQLIVLNGQFDWEQGDGQLLNDVTVSPHDLAYIIYTSGSTGIPKGVLIEHRQICATLLHMRKYYGLDSEDTCVYYRSYCFDGSIEETLLPMISGCRVVIVPQDTEEDLAAYICRIIPEYRVSKLNTPPAFMGLFLEKAEQADPGAFRSLRHLVSGGDVLNKGMLSRIPAGIIATIYNTYGPTENTIDSTVFAADRNADYNTVPIGRPVINATCYVLNKCMRPVPIGVTGELYVGGAGVGRGYLNREEITAQRFLPNPFNKKYPQTIFDNSRLYKTGDLVRWLPDGNIEFIGRADGQVKIRGFRIEPGEIESRLLAHPEIEDVVVDARQFPGGNKELVAYLVSKTPQQLTMLRSYLKSKMPDYMIPAYFMQISRLPLTPAGKVDRRALPLPQGDVLLPDADEYVAPENAAEKMLADIWEDVLSRNRISIHDNFINLGGTSLSAIQVILKLRAAGFELSIRNFLENLVLKDQADILLRTNEALKTAGSDKPQVVNLTTVQASILENLQGLEYHAVSLSFDTPLSGACLKEALETLVAHHDMLRAIFQVENGTWVQSISTQATVLPEVYDYSSLEATVAEEKQQAVYTSWQQAGKDNFPQLLRVALFHFHSSDRLLLAMHPLIADGYSWQVLLQDLSRIYKDIARNIPVEWPRAEGTFAEWSAGTDGKGYNTLKKVPATVIQVADLAAGQLQHANTAFDTTTDELLLTALLQTLWKGPLKDNITIQLSSVDKEERLGAYPTAIGNFHRELLLQFKATGDISWESLLLQVRNTSREGTSPAGLPQVTFTYNETGGKDEGTVSFSATVDHLPAKHCLLPDNTTTVLAASAILFNGQLQLAAGTHDNESIAITPFLQDWSLAIQEVTAYCTDYTKQHGPLWPLSYNQRYYFRDGNIDVSRALLPEFTFETGRLPLFRELCSRFLNTFDVLRARFIIIDNEIMQRIVPIAATVPDIRIFEVTNANDTAATEQVFFPALFAPFDLSDQQFVRFIVVHDKQVARCQIAIHHALTDGASNFRLLKYIEMMLQGQPLLPANINTGNYSRFIIAQRRFMRSFQARQQLAYWQKKLVDIDPSSVFLFKNDPAENAVPIFRVTQVLQKELFRRITTFCQQHETDISSFLLAAFVLSMYKKGAKKTVIIDTFSTGREQLLPGIDMQELLGVVAGKLPLRISIDPLAGLLSICRTVMEAYYEARLNQQVPYTLVAAAFSNRHKIPLSDLSQVKYNYFIQLSQSLEHPDQSTDAVKEVKILSANPAFMANYKLVVDCVCFADAVRIEYKYPCTEQYEGWEEQVLSLIRWLPEHHAEKLESLI